MAFWEWGLEIVVAVLILLALLILALFTRRRILTRGGGTFELSLNQRTEDQSARTGRGWVLGIGRYSGGDLEWFRAFSWRFSPKQRIERGSIEILKRRDPHGPEKFALYAGHVVVACRRDDGLRFQLGLSPESLTALLAWLESSPPGRNSSRVI